MVVIDRTYALRFIKLPPKTIIAGQPFDLIFALTDDLGLELPGFPDLISELNLLRLGKLLTANAACRKPVSIEVETLGSAPSPYKAINVNTSDSFVAVNSSKGLLHKVSVRIDDKSSSSSKKSESAFLALKLARQRSSENGTTPSDPIDVGLMHFTGCSTLMHLEDDDTTSLVLPARAGPLQILSAALSKCHSKEKVTNTEVHFWLEQQQQLLRVIERPLDKAVGDHLWHGSVLLANSILAGKVTIPEVRTIIEIGAGCGLVSMSIAQKLLDSSKRIIATDLQDVVDTTMSETLQADILTTSRVERKPLEWGNQDDIQRLLASIQNEESVWLVAADVLYNPGSHEALLRSMRQLSQHFMRSCITIAYRPRSTGDINFFGLASKAGYGFKIIFQHADVQMWHYEGV